MDVTVGGDRSSLVSCPQKQTRVQRNAIVALWVISLVEVAELQMGSVMQLIDLLRRGKAREIAATWEAMERHETARAEQAKRTIWATGCHSWYLDDRGIPSAWPWPWERFKAEMAAPRLDDYDLR